MPSRVSYSVYVIKTSEKNGSQILLKYMEFVNYLHEYLCLSNHNKHPISHPHELDTAHILQLFVKKMNIKHRILSWLAVVVIMYIILYPSRCSHSSCFNHLGLLVFALRWRHNDHPGVSNHQPHGCLLNRLFRRRWKKTSKLRVTGLCAGNSPGPVNSPHKGPVTRKMFPFDDVIMGWNWQHSK